MTIKTRYLPTPWDHEGGQVPIDPNLDIEGKCQEVIDLMLKSGRIAPDTRKDVRYGIAMSEVLAEGFESVRDGLTLSAQAESERAVMEIAAERGRG